MADIILQSSVFVAIIILGYVLRKVGFFKESDFYVLSRIVINITLPAAIVTSFSGKEFDPNLFFVLFLGFGGSLLYTDRKSVV